jgi:hypothetical protein
VSLALSFWGLAASRRNQVSTMQRYMVGIGVFGILPLLYGAGYYFGEAWAYITTGDKEKLFVWQVINKTVPMKCHLHTHYVNWRH